MTSMETPCSLSKITLRLSGWWFPSQRISTESRAFALLASVIAICYILRNSSLYIKLVCIFQYKLFAARHRLALATANQRIPSVLASSGKWFTVFEKISEHLQITVANIFDMESREKCFPLRICSQVKASRFGVKLCLQERYIYQ